MKSGKGQRHWKGATEPTSEGSGKNGKLRPPKHPVELRPEKGGRVRTIGDEELGGILPGHSCVLHQLDPAVRVTTYLPAGFGALGGCQWREVSSPALWSR